MRLVDLPDDVLELLFVALAGDVRSAVRLGATCHALQRIGRSAALWHRIYAARSGLEAAPPFIAALTAWSDVAHAMAGGFVRTECAGRHTALVSAPGLSTCLMETRLRGSVAYTGDLNGAIFAYKPPRRFKDYVPAHATVGSKHPAVKVKIALETHTNAMAMDVSRDGSTLFAFRRVSNQVVNVYDTTTFLRKSSIRTEPVEHDIYTLRTHGDIVVPTPSTGKLVLYDVRTGAAAQQFATADRDEMFAADVSDGYACCTGSYASLFDRRAPGAPLTQHAIVSGGEAITCALHGAHPLAVIGGDGMSALIVDDQGAREGRNRSVWRLIVWNDTVVSAVGGVLTIESLVRNAETGRFDAVHQWSCNASSSSVRGIDRSLDRIVACAYSGAMVTIDDDIFD